MNATPHHNDESWISDAALQLARASADELRRPRARAGAPAPAQAPARARQPARPRDPRLRTNIPSRAPASRVEITQVYRPASMPRPRWPVSGRTLLLAFAIGCAVSLLVNWP